ncbi:hypothetical protein [Streptomyces flavofungini]|uniref:hypothetical protein n=1 Tax=Streptomyces flavofungini TaxID=68200 RepID=UPI0025AFDBF0|nr:hypothetical protein [Streptomyces flavofungini]WJV51722.1 hypothetical protein QUY26_40400 [Streptomyces flavofungini]
MNTTDQAATHADELYAHYMAHLYSCPPCQRENYCPAGNCLRIAWKRAQGAASRAYRAHADRRHR